MATINRYSPSWYPILLVALLALSGCQGSSGKDQAIQEFNALSAEGVQDSRAVTLCTPSMGTKANDGIVLSAAKDSTLGEVRRLANESHADIPEAFSEKTDTSYVAICVYQGPLAGLGKPGANNLVTYYLDSQSSSAIAVW